MANLAARAEKVASLVERLAQHRAPGLRIAGVWLKTFEGKFRFDVQWQAHSFLIFLDEDVVDDLLERGLKASQEQIERVIEFSLPVAASATAS